MKLIELERDGTSLGVVSHPVLINPESVAYVGPCGPGVMPGLTQIVFANGFTLILVGKCEDIGRQIQEALGEKNVTEDASGWGFGRMNA